MKLSWFIPIALLIPLRLSATDAAVGARVATITINPKEITVRLSRWKARRLLRQ